MELECWEEKQGRGGDPGAPPAQSLRIHSWPRVQAKVTGLLPCACSGGQFQRWDPEFGRFGVTSGSLPLHCEATLTLSEFLRTALLRTRRCPEDSQLELPRSNQRQENQAPSLLLLPGPAALPVPT